MGFDAQRWQSLCNDSDVCQYLELPGSPTDVGWRRKFGSSRLHRWSGPARPSAREDLPQAFATTLLSSNGAVGDKTDVEPFCA
jgi:hypothetical protein